MTSATKSSRSQGRWAHEALESKPESADWIRELTGRRGAGDGTVKVGLMSAPFDVQVVTSLWGRRRELLELVEMAKRGDLTIETKTYPLDDALRAYDDLHEGRVRGRGVIVP